MALHDFDEMMSASVAGKADVKFDSELVKLNPDGEEPIIETATITLPDGQKMQTPTVRAGFIPKYIFDKQAFQQRRYAHNDFVKWSVRLMRDIDIINKKLAVLFSPKATPKQKDDAGSIDRDIDLFFGDAEHWYSAINSRGFSKKVRKAVKAVLDGELRTEIGHLRNLREHWAQCMPYFEHDKPIKKNRDTRSVRWYREKYPGRSPWGIDRWAMEKEPKIAGVFQVSRMSAELRKISSVIEANVDTHVLFDKISAKY